MKIRDVMVSEVRTCCADDDLERAARILWEGDCGSVPVVEADEFLVGIVTDRDACMAAYTRGLPLAAIRVGDVMSRQVKSVRPDEECEAALGTMRDLRVRRVPVVDTLGRVVGIVSLADLARRAAHEPNPGAKRALEAGVLATLAAVCRPWNEAPEPAAAVPVERPAVLQPQRSR